MKLKMLACGRPQGLSTPIPRPHLNQPPPHLCGLNLRTTPLLENDEESKKNSVYYEN